MIFHVVEPEGRPGGVNVALDVGLLERLLVGADLQGLKEGRIEHADDERHKGPETDRHDRQRPAARSHVVEQDSGRGERQPEKDGERGNTRVDVGVRRALDVAVGRGDEIPLGDQVSGRFAQGDRGTDGRQVRLHPRRDTRGDLCRTDTAVEEVKARRHDERDDQDDEEPGDDERDEGQREYIEAEVLVKQRVDLVEGLSVREEQITVPLTGGVESGDEAHHQGDRRVDAPGVGPHNVLVAPHDLVFGVKGEVARTETVGEQQISPHDEEEDRPEGQTESDLDQKECGEDARQMY